MFGTKTGGSGIDMYQGSSIELHAIALDSDFERFP